MTNQLSLRAGEARMLKKGKERLETLLKKAIEKNQYSNTPAGKFLRSIAVQQFSQKLQSDLKDDSERIGKHKSCLTQLQKLDPNLVGHIVCSAVINGSMTRCLQQKIILDIGHQVEDELRHQELQIQCKEKTGDSNYIRYILKAVRKKDTTYNRQRFNFIRKAKYHGFSWQPLPLQTVRTIGMYCLEVFIRETGLFEKIQFIERRRRKLFIQATKQCLDWMEKAHTNFWKHNPMYLPLGSKPRDWENNTQGIFTDNFFGRVKLIKDIYLPKEYQEELDHFEMPEVYKAVNALQATPWRINRAVFSIIENLKNISECLLIPTLDPIPMPKKPHDISTNKEARKAYSRLKSRRDHEEVVMRGKRLHFLKLLELVSELSEMERFYYGYTLDFRGRAYSLTTFISPQGCDMSKALLEFADPKPLGKEGLRYLRIHGANSYGYDKATLDDRVQWVIEHEDMIKRCGNDPLSNQDWMDADKPFQFLAFCFDYCGYLENGINHMSHLPCNTDGSCNGIQHYSALLKCKTSAQNVNLCPSESVSDIYTTVTDRVNEIINKDYLSGDPVAKLWVDKVHRSLIKRPIMTLPYSVTKQGMTVQLCDEIKKLREKGKDYDFGEYTDFKACLYLTKAILETTKDQLNSARTGMDWIKQCVSIALEHNIDIRYINPVGFPWFQSYRKPKTTRVKSVIYNKLVQKVNFLEKTTLSCEIDSRKSIQGCCPNFIHSLDSSHMQKTINACHDSGFRYFSMVHDSYGCHASDMGEMNRILREQFVDQYTKFNPLESFRNSIQDHLPNGVELPEVPLIGDLDLNDVLDSEYFFS